MKLEIDKPPVAQVYSADERRSRTNITGFLDTFAVPTRLTYSNVFTVAGGKKSGGLEFRLAEVLFYESGFLGSRPVQGFAE